MEGRKTCTLQISPKRSYTVNLNDLSTICNQTSLEGPQTRGVQSLSRRITFHSLPFTFSQKRHRRPQLKASAELFYKVPLTPLILHFWHQSQKELQFSQYIRTDIIAIHTMTLPGTIQIDLPDFNSIFSTFFALDIDGSQISIRELTNRD